MKRIVQTVGITLALLYGAGIVWLYVRQPRTIEEIKTQAAVEVNVYQIKRENFDEGLKQFNAEQYQVAVDQFRLADPAERDATTQFYIAYAYYRLGRGRFTDDDEMFRQGLASVDRAIALAPNNIFESERTDLEFRSAAALRERFKEGLMTTAEDFNPFKWFRKVK